MARSLYSRDLFAELDRLQREMQQAFDLSPTIRGFGRSGFPALNVGGTQQAVEVYAFAPGLVPESIEVQLDRSLLTIAGERRTTLPNDDDKKSALHINERFEGAFRRVVGLPQDVDPNGVSADYRDGVLHVTVKRLESSQPRRIAVQ